MTIGLRHLNVAHIGDNGHCMSMTLWMISIFEHIQRRCKLIITSMSSIGKRRVIRECGQQDSMEAEESPSATRPKEPGDTTSIEEATKEIRVSESDTYN